MISTIGFIINSKEKEEAIKKATNFMNILLGHKFFYIKKYDTSKNIPTKNNEFTNCSLIKNIAPFFNNLNELKESKYTEFNEQKTSSLFKKRFETFDEYLDICRHFYTNIVITEDLKMKHDKYFFSEKWVKNFKNDFLDNESYQDFYFVTFVIEFFDLDEIINEHYKIDGVSDKDIDDIMTAGHESVRTVHADLSKENLDNIEHNIFTIHANAEDTSKLLESYVKKVLRIKPTIETMSDETKLIFAFKSLTEEVKVSIKIKEKPLLIIHSENHAWQHYDYYYILTENGKLLEYDNLTNQPVNLIDLNISEIEDILKDVECVYLRDINPEELVTVKTLISKMVKDTNNKGNIRGCGMDCGDIEYLAINERLSDKPIIIGLRGDIIADSFYESNKKVADFIDKLIG